MDSSHGWRSARSGPYRSAWAFLIVAAVCFAAGQIINKLAGNPSRLSKHAVLELGGLVILLWILGAVSLLFAFGRFSRARRRAEQEREQAASRQLAAEQLMQAGRLAGQLLAGEWPAVGQVWDVVLQPGERVLLDGSAGYSRHYGLGSPATHTHVTRYTHVSTRHYGNVGAGRVVLGHAIDEAGNRRRAQGAAFAAAARWRDQQQCRAVVTDRRLLCQVQSKGWVSFDHRAATAIKAVPTVRTACACPEASPSVPPLTGHERPPRRGNAARG